MKKNSMFWLLVRNHDFSWEIKKVIPRIARPIPGD